MSPKVPIVLNVLIILFLQTPTGFNIGSPGHRPGYNVNPQQSNPIGVEHHHLNHFIISFSDSDNVPHTFRMSLIIFYSFTNFTVTLLFPLINLIRYKPFANELISTEVLACEILCLAIKSPSKLYIS
jgi:hypothetical protein